MNQENKVMIKNSIIGAFLIVFIVSCKHSEEHEYHGVMQKIEAESQQYKSPGISSESFTEGIETVRVLEDGFDFLIPERKGQVASYNCTECHSKPLDQLQKGSEGKKAAHWNVKLVHAGVEIMDCKTCHDENNLDDLTSLTNSTIDFNYSYKLCSQCHQQEFKDWKGGAHGKQLESWAMPRVSNTCVNCHNPHSPQFEKRWPVRYNTQKVEERK